MVLGPYEGSDLHNKKAIKNRTYYVTFRVPTYLDGLYATGFLNR